MEMCGSESGRRKKKREGRMRRGGTIYRQRGRYETTGAVIKGEKSDKDPLNASILGITIKNKLQYSSRR